MAQYLLSRKAAQDFKGIYRYTFQTFGEAQAEAYTQRLIECFGLLAKNPQLGREIPEIRQGYFRFAHEHHTIFYTLKASSVFIVRILHERMDVLRHLD